MTYEVEYQVHESQVAADDWIRVPLSESEAHDWFDRYQQQHEVLAVRVVRVDRTVVRNHQRVVTQDASEGSGK